ERPIVMVLIVAGGRITRVEVFEPEDVDAALARFVALRPSATRDPLAVLAKPNAATVARDRVEAAFEARAWAALRALCVADAKPEGRRRHVLVSYDVDGWIADRQRWAQAGVHQERRLVRTVGDRVAIERIVGTSGPPDGRVEVEYLSLVEVDESGRILATVGLDPDDWRTAFTEFWTRALAVHGAAASLRPFYEFAMGTIDHDP